MKTKYARQIRRGLYYGRIYSWGVKNNLFEKVDFKAKTGWTMHRIFADAFVHEAHKIHTEYGGFTLITSEDPNRMRVELYSTKEYARI